MREIHYSSYMSRSKPTKESYFDGIYRTSEKESSVEKAKVSLIHFERFCEKIYKKKSDEVIAELKIKSKNDSEITIDFLTDLIHYLSDIKKEDKKAIKEFNKISKKLEELK